MSETKRKAEKELIIFNEQSIQSFIENIVHMSEAAARFNCMHDMEGLKYSLGKIGDQMRAIKLLIGDTEKLQKDKTDGQG